MKKTGIIYKATSPSGKVYVGQTTNTLAWRKTYHISKAKNPNSNVYNTRFSRAIRKYGDSIIWAIILKNIKNSNLNDAEKDEITKHNGFHGGYNSTTGGDSVSFIPEVIEKLRQASAGKNNPRYGVKLSDDTKRKISNAHKGKRLGKDNHFYGKTHTAEAKLKISKSKRGKTPSNVGNTLFGVYKNGKLVGKWKNQSQCARELEIPQVSISGCLLGKQKQCQEYTIKYLGESKL